LGAFELTHGFVGLGTTEVGGGVVPVEEGGVFGIVAGGACVAEGEGRETAFDVLLLISGDGGWGWGEGE